MIILAILETGAADGDLRMVTATATDPVEEEDVEEETLEETLSVNLPRKPTATDTQQGLALFVVMVVVVILTVVVFQLSHMTKVEERVAKNKQGLLELRLSLASVARMFLVRLHTDWEEDQQDDAADSAGTGDPAGDPAGNPGGGDPGGGDSGGGDSIGDPGSGAGGNVAGDPVGSTDPEEPEAKGTDTNHEVWPGPFTENVNQMEVEVRAVTGESAICLTYPYFFKYAPLEEEEDTGDGLAPDPGEGGDLADTGDSGDGTDGGVEDADDPEDPNAEPEELNRPKELGDTYEPPEPERVDRTTEMISRLVQGIIAYNQEFDFEYEDTPNPDAVASALVEWVLKRWEDDETRAIHSLEGVKNLEEVSWELWNGPKLPEDYEDEEERDWEELLPDGAFSQFSEYLEGGLSDNEGFREIEGGVEPVPRPFGLKHALTVHSTGKINLNTASPELLAAIMLSFDLDEALEVAREIETYRNSYEEPDEDAEEEESATAEETAPPFNIYTSFEGLREINEEWIDDSGVEESIYALLEKDLKNISVFRSTFFTALLHGEREDQVVDGELVVKRSTSKIEVISWRETTR